MPSRPSRASTRSCASRSGASSRAELRPHAPEWEEARWFPDDVFSAVRASIGLLGLKYPEAYGGQGGDFLHDAVLTEELARCGSGGAGRRASAPTSASPRRRCGKFGTEEQKQRYLAPAIARREDRRARHHRARRRLRRRRRCARAPSASTAASWSTARRCTSPTACARTSSSPRSGRPPRAATTACRFLIVDRQDGRHAPSQAREARLARVRHGAIAFDDVFVAEENLLGREHEGFQLIMANFQWERLLMALGAVGAMQVASTHAGVHASERGPSGGR